jgi:hypothetical protein
MNVDGGSCEESKFDHSHSYVRIGEQPVLRSRSSANRRMMAPVKLCGQHQLSSRVEGLILGERRRDGQEKGNQESGQRRQSEISWLSGFSIFVKRWRRQNVGRHPVNVAIAV